jgi:hypothetical protein
MGKLPNSYELVETFQYNPNPKKDQLKKYRIIDEYHFCPWSLKFASVVFIAISYNTEALSSFKSILKQRMS